jgi:hypothetical protein
VTVVGQVDTTGSEPSYVRAPGGRVRFRLTEPDSTTPAGQALLALSGQRIRPRRGPRHFLL